MSMAACGAPFLNDVKIGLAFLDYRRCSPGRWRRRETQAVGGAIAKLVAHLVR